MKKLVFGATIKLSYDSQNGIMRKVFSEVKAFESEYEVVVWGFTDNEIIYYEGDKKTVVTTFSSKIQRRERYFLELTKYVISHNINAFYFRYATSDFYLLNMLKSFKKAGILNIIEIPTYPYAGEFKYTLKRRMIYALDVLLRSGLKKYVDRIVTFSEEYKTIFGIPVIGTMNGFDFNQVTVIKHEPKEKYTLIAVASMLPHHGYDRIINGMNVYYNQSVNDDIDLLMVGDGPELEKYKNAVTGKCSTHIKFCGNLYGQNLNEAYLHADAAVGSLGLHRIGLQHGSTLKIREYVARGLPVIYSTPDSAVDNKYYTLEFPANDSDIDISKVIAFLKGIYSCDNINEKIHNDAMMVCDMKATMMPVVNYLKKENS